MNGASKIAIQIHFLILKMYVYCDDMYIICMRLLHFRYPFSYRLILRFASRPFRGCHDIHTYSGT